MNKILVTYATNSGSTAEVAKAIMEEIQKSGVQVELHPIAEVRELASYSGIVLGAPMILGWHRAALRFIRKNKSALAKILPSGSPCNLPCHRRPRPLPPPALRLRAHNPAEDPDWNCI